MSLPPTIETNLRRFLREIPQEQTDLKNLGLGSTSLPSILQVMRSMYHLNKDQPNL